MSAELILSVARSFSPFPGGRTRKDGPFSGAVFLEDILLPELEKNDSVVIDIDGVAGLPSSFWEEVFGGLIRKNFIDIKDLGVRLKVRTTEPDLEVYRSLAYRYAEDEAKSRATS